MKTIIGDVEIIDIPKIIDYRGNISFIEKDLLPYEMKRVYYLYDVPNGASRGGHAHKNLFQFLIALSGSFDVILNDGYDIMKVTLDKPDKGLLIPVGIWRELEAFSSGAVCLVLASDTFDEDDYIRDFNIFRTFKKLELSSSQGL